MRRLGNTRIYRPLELGPSLGMSSQIADILFPYTSTDINDPPPGSCPTPIVNPYYAAAWWTRSSYHSVHKTVVPAVTGSSSYTFSGSLVQQLVVNTNFDEPGFGNEYYGSVVFYSRLNGAQTLLGSYEVRAEPLGTRYTSAVESNAFSFPVTAGSSVEIQAVASPDWPYSNSEGQMDLTLNGLNVVCD